MLKHIFPSLSSAAVLLGTIVGAGVLGIPYVFAQVGFVSGTMLLVLVGGISTLTALFIGEVVLRTPGQHQLVGYAELYLGKGAKHLQAAVLIFGIYGALLAFTIGQGEVLAALFGGEAFWWSLVFFGLFSFMMVRGISFIKHIEFALVLALFGTLLVIGGFSLPQLSLEGLVMPASDYSLMLVAYGVILFAYFGLTAVPQVHEILAQKKKERMLARVLLWGSIIPVVLYFFFALFIVGVTGVETTQVATVGLGEALGGTVLVVGNLFAFFAMATTFLAIGSALREVFVYDYRRVSQTASFLTLSVPLVLFLAGVRDFIFVVSVVGAVTLGVTGMISVVLFWAARSRGARRPEYRIPTWFAYSAGAVLFVLYAAGIAAVFVM